MLINWSDSGSIINNVEHSALSSRKIIFYCVSDTAPVRLRGYNPALLANDVHDFGDRVSWRSQEAREFQ